MSRRDGANEYEKPKPTPEGLGGQILDENSPPSRVEAVAHEVVADAKVAIASSKSVAAATELGGSSNPKAEESAQAILDEARKRGVAGLQVKSASAEEATIVRTDNGRATVIVLGAEEKGREVDVAGKKFLFRMMD